MIYSILYIYICVFQYVVYQTELKKKILIFCHFSFPVCFLLQSYLINKERLRVISNVFIQRIYVLKECLPQIYTYSFLQVIPQRSVQEGLSKSGYKSSLPAPCSHRISRSDMCCHRDAREAVALGTFKGNSISVGEKKLNIFQILCPPL